MNTSTGRQTRHHLPPSLAEELDPTHGEPRALTKQEFGRRLHALILEKGWNQSELARRAELGRDAISTYVRGRSFPEPSSLKRIADALGKDPTDLLPNTFESAMDRDLPAIEIREASGHPGHSWLRVNRRVTTDQALRVLQILNERKEEVA
jgi:transcriptional regulator with XRE-family HTH domain